MNITKGITKVNRGFTLDRKRGYKQAYYYVYWRNWVGRYCKKTFYVGRDGCYSNEWDNIVGEVAKQFRDEYLIAKAGGENNLCNFETKWVAYSSDWRKEALKKYAEIKLNGELTNE